jgi:hypothetical protein
MLRPRRSRRLKQAKRKRGTTEKTSSSIGRFTNFPSMLHGTLTATHESPTARVQQAIAHAIYNLNTFKYQYPMSIADHPGTYKGEASFEAGVADGVFFDFLDQENVQKLSATLNTKTAPATLDFLLIVIYRYERDGKRISLNFDHHIIRFSFYNKELELSLFHSKGPRRMPLDELLELVIKRINLEAEQMGVKPLKTEKMKTL